jgi:beta-galactosidase
MRYRFFLSRKGAKGQSCKGMAQTGVQSIVGFILMRLCSCASLRDPFVLIRTCVKPFLLLYIFLSIWFISFSQRQDISLNNNWLTIARDEPENPSSLSYMPSPTAKGWKQVNVPHNWDAYDGYRRLLHGNRHGDSWYRKTFSVRQSKNAKRFFLFFEGVGSYATVFLNGKYVGYHAGGRTTFTIDVTDLIKSDGSNNQIAVRADHPSNIKDLPWVCGGCSDERGFSEGSQPMGIFRPVYLIVTNDLRIQPFGIHAWADIKNGKADLFVNTTIKNYSVRNRNIILTHRLVDREGKIIAETALARHLSAGDSIEISNFRFPPILGFKSWSPASPYLYKIVSIIQENGKRVDSVATDFGFRTINWKTPTNQFFINGKPFFINGVAEYEHLLGQSHAFSKEQIIARMKWLRMAGFNAFRDGHQPHNLLYGELCNQNGIILKNC